MATTTIIGASAIDDVYIYAGGADLNYGGASNIAAGLIINVYRYLIRCHTAYIPGGNVSGFRFIGYRYGLASQTVDGTATHYRVLVDWNEGTNTGAGVSAGEVTWNSAKHGSVAWTTAGCGSAGNDYENTSRGTYVFPADTTAGAPYDKVTVTLDTDLAQNWHDGVWGNYGLMVKTGSEATSGSWYGMLATGHPDNFPPYFEVDAPAKGAGFFLRHGERR